MGSVQGGTVFAAFRRGLFLAGQPRALSTPGTWHNMEPALDAWENDEQGRTAYLTSCELIREQGPAHWALKDSNCLSPILIKLEGSPN